MNKLIISFLITGLCFCLSAQEKQYTKKNMSKSNTMILKAVTWFDGDTEKTVWVIPDLIAEFGNGNQTKSYDISAFVKSSHGSVQIWKLSDVSKQANLTKTDSATNGLFSPVYSIDSLGEGTKMALTGKVIVFLKKGIDSLNWASSNGLKIAQKMSFGNGVVVLATSTDPITLANSLRTNPSVESTQPDWWIEGSIK